MFVDASAFMAILKNEEDADEIRAVIEAYKGPRYSSPLAHFETAVSFAMFSAPKGKKPTSEQIEKANEIVQDLFDMLEIKMIAIMPDMASRAIAAAAAYGKATGHPAQLNFGDCFAYAAAKAYRQPILFKGRDFSKTDAKSARPTRDA